MSTIAITAPARPVAARTAARTVEQARGPVDGSARRSRMRLTRRGRVVLALLGALVAAGVWSVAGQAVAERPVADVVHETMYVAPGESLWTIAAEVSTPEQDVRDVVAAIASLNELETLELQVGQELLLPAS